MRVVLCSLILLITAAAGGITDKHSNTEASPKASRESIVVDDTKVFNQIRAEKRIKFREHQEAVVLWNQQVEKNRIAAQQAEESRRSETLARQRATTPTTYVAQQPQGGSPCQYADLIRSIWQKDAEWAIGIAYRESRCIPTARNASGASGLFQMMMPMHSGLFIAACGSTDWTNPECNIRAAWILYQGSGRSPWNL
jgi:soluble lytic murein transglycosylase-like protein